MSNVLNLQTQQQILALGRLGTFPHLDGITELRHKPRTPPRRLPSKSRLDAMIEEATVDALDESEQRMGFFAVMEECLEVPFVTEVLGVAVTVERIDLTEADEIVAICRRGKARQPIGILHLSLSKPRPKGAEWIEAYRRWSGGW